VRERERACLHARERLCVCVCVCMCVCVCVSVIERELRVAQVSAHRRPLLLSPTRKHKFKNKFLNKEIKFPKRGTQGGHKTYNLQTLNDI